MKNFLITLIIILIPVKSFGLIEVDITRGNLNPLPIAVSPLSIDEESRKNFQNILKKKNIGSEISSIVENNLKVSGLFNPLNKDAFLQEPDIANLKPRFEDWNLIKAQALITGKVSYVEEKLRVEFRLWDVLAGKEMMALAFTTVPNNWRRVGHIITDKVYERLTGEKGYFDTRIIYVAEEGPKTQRVKKLAIMDQDGANNNITITPNGSGNIVLDGLTFPNADGSANQVLKTDGSGALSFTDPGGGAMNLISTTNISDAATVSITGMDSTYKHYKMILTQLHPANDGVDLQGRAIVGGSAHTGSTSYFSIVEHSRTGNASAEFDNQESKSFWNFNHSSENIGNANSDCVNVIIDIFNPSDTTFEKLIRTEINYTHAAVHEQFSRGYGINTLRLTSAFTGIQFFFDSGNIATGTIKLYGLS